MVEIEVLMVGIGFGAIAIALAYLHFYAPAKPSPIESKLKPVGKYGAEIHFSGMIDKRFGDSPDGYEGYVTEINNKNGRMDLVIDDKINKRTVKLFGLRKAENIIERDWVNSGVGKVIWLCNVDANNTLFPWDTLLMKRYLENQKELLREQIYVDARREIDDSMEYTFSRIPPETAQKFEKTRQYGMKIAKEID